MSVCINAVYNVSLFIALFIVFVYLMIIYYSLFILLFTLLLLIQCPLFSCFVFIKQLRYICNLRLILGINHEHRICQHLITVALRKLKAFPLRIANDTLLNRKSLSR